MSGLRWERRRILIWGKTRPEVSHSYREVVCTGGVFEDTRRLVRLYPIPLRYLDDEKVFKKYQWIEADVARNLRDPRPESYKIKPEGIRTGDTIPTKRGNWDERAEWILHSDNLFPSLEVLRDRQDADRTSLGLVQPAEIMEIRSDRISEQERTEFDQRYKDAISQLDLPLDPDTGREIKPLRGAEFRFRVTFRCDDPRCKEHTCSILDWEMDALYFRMRTERELAPQMAARRVVEKLEEICGPEKDLRFFLGNIFQHPHNFTIVGLWYPKKKGVDTQGSLFT